MEDENSLFRYYCKLLSIRHNYPAIARGTYTAVNGGSKNIGGFRIDYEGEVLGLFHNNSAEELCVDLASCTALNGYSFEKICAAIGAGDAKLEGTVLTLGAYTSVILQ